MPENGRGVLSGGSNSFMSRIKCTKKQVRQQNGLNGKLLPLQFILIVLPLILYLYKSNSGYSAYAWHSADDTYYDVFLQGKMVVFLMIAAIILGLAIYKTVKMSKTARTKVLLLFTPLMIYLGFVILSTICSEHIAYSVWGAKEANEPFGVLLGYVVVAYYAYIAIDCVNDVICLIRAAVVGSICMVLIGIMQTIGRDPLAMESVQRLFAGNDFIDRYGPLRLSFPVGQAYGTLFNPNYVGTYVVLYAPLALLGILLSKTMRKKVLCGFSVAGLLVMLLASQSRTGLIAILVVTVIFVVFRGRSIWKRWYMIIPGVILALFVFFVLDSTRNHLLTDRLKQMFLITASEAPVLGVDTTGNGVRVVCRDTEYTVRMTVSDTDFSYLVSEGEEQREVSYDENRLYGYFSLSTGEKVAIRTAVFEDNYAFGLDINGREFFFTNQMEKGNYKYINNYGRPDECIMPANVFPGYEAVASGRGYVWGRSIPLLLDNFIVGSGPDTFAIEFPQNDYVARYQSGFENIIFTRPHNFYLQMGIQTGVLSLLAFLVFYAIYFAESCRRYCFRKFNRMEEWIGFAVFLSTVGFMASGLANDSLIVVSPIYYVMLGAGMAVNHKLCPIIQKEK